MTDPYDSAFGIVRATNFEPIPGRENTFRAVKWEISGGLTKREYFAGKALEGVLASSTELLSEFGVASPKVKLIVLAAISYADVLIAELNKEAKP